MAEKLTHVWRDYPRTTLIGLTLIPRLALLFAAAHRATPFGAPAHDGYLQIAQNLVGDGVLGLGPDHVLTRGPLYPLMLAPGVFIGHVQIWSAALHLLASIGTCLLVFAAAKSLTGSVDASFYAACFVTLDPWLIWFVKNPMTTVTATFFVACAVFFFTQVLKGNRPIASSIGLGGACALAALDHPALIVVIAGFTLAIFILFAARREAPLIAFDAKTAAVVLIGMWATWVAVLIPYAIRNFQESGRHVVISDGAGLSYFMGASRYESSPYPWADVSWSFDDLARRLGVDVSDLDVQYFTIRDRFYPELNRQARADLESLVLHRPGYLMKRTAVMAFWFFAGDYSLLRTLAHCVFLAIMVVACWVSWKTKGWALTAPFLVIVLPGLALHSLTMALIGHAAYAIPYVVPLSMPLALALEKQPDVAATRWQKFEKAGDVYATD